MTDLDERGIAAGLHGALGQLSVAREDLSDANALDREALKLLREAEGAIEKLIEAAEKTPGDDPMRLCRKCIHRDDSRAAHTYADDGPCFKCRQPTKATDSTAVDKAVAGDERDCRCLMDCSGLEKCSLSGEWHVHADSDPNGVYGVCPAHPDAPGDQ